MKSNAHLRDHELLEPTTRAHEEHLASCAACRQRRDVQVTVRGAVKLVDREAPPSPAALALLQEAASKPSGRRWVLMIAAAALVVSATLVLFLKERRQQAPFPAPLVEELALDHLHYQHNVEAAEVRGDPATIASWFAGKLGFAPHLGAMEATSLEGAKPCRIAGKWTALVWLDRAGHWLSLFTMPEQIAYARGCASAQGVRVCAVPDPRGGSRVLVGDLSPEELLRLADESLQ